MSFLIDKDENSLTELNREINLFFPKIKKKRINYIVLDITSSNIDNIFKIKRLLITSILLL